MNRSLLALAVLACFTVFLAACEPLPVPAANNTTADTPAPQQENTAPISGVSVTGSMVAYFDNVEGYFAEPTTEGEYPGVILIHEWWGLNDNMKETADKLAAEGFRVLAVDLYQGKVANNSTEAQLYRTQADPTVMTDNLAAANTYLKEQGSEKTATWGYCFGGGESMRFALEGETDATVVYYGNLQPAIMQPQDVDAPVLLIYGDQDKSTTADSARELQLKLKPYGVDAELHVYSGVGHAFANPSNAGHNEEFTQDAWAKTIVFLQANLQ